MRTILLLAVLYIPSVFAEDGGVVPAVVQPVEHTSGSVVLADGGLAPAMLLPDGGVVVASTETLDSVSIAKDIVEAGRTKNWRVLVAGLVILLTWGLRLFGGKFVPFLKTDRGGIVLALVIASVGVLFNAWKAGIGITVDVFVDAIAMGVFSIGGFTTMKKTFFPSDTDP